MQLTTGVSFHRMAANQVSCPSTLQATKSSSLSVRTVQVEGASLLCDVARGITRPLVQLEDRPAVFHAIHDVAHPVIHATKRMLIARFVWKGVGKDVAAMCRACQQYQRGKVHKQPAAPVQAIPRAGTQVLPRARGLGWSFTSFFRGARAPAHHHRKVNQVV